MIGFLHANFTLFVVKCVFRANHDATEIGMTGISKCAIGSFARGPLFSGQAVRLDFAKMVYGLRARGIGEICVIRYH